MRILFADTCAWDYNAESPYVGALGGTQSAVCYLSEALALAGHEVCLVSNTTHPGAFHKVQCLSWAMTPDADLAALKPDVVFIIQSMSIGPRLRNILGPAAHLVAWTGDDYKPGVPLTAQLLREGSLQAFDAVALASEWQRQNFISAVRMPRERTFVLRYAVAPPFQRLFKPAEAILASKPQPGILAYTSTPFRGLDMLADAFPEIRKQVPGLQLKVFSSMKVYLDSRSKTQDSRFKPLYEKLQKTEGVEYCGAVPQAILAEHLRKVHILAYPNTFDETSCIAVLEAMAAGCHVVTSARGALPETTGGFADLLPAESGRQNYFSRFIDCVVGAVRHITEKPELSEQKLRKQVDFVNAAYTWQQRAEEVVSIISSIRPWTRTSPEFSSASNGPAKQPLRANHRKPLLASPSWRIKSCRYGLVLFSANDSRIGKSLDQYGEWAEQEISLLKKLVRLGHTVLDVGAYIGTHTLFFSRQVGPPGKVLAFEPQLPMYQILCANLALNDVINVHPYLESVGRNDQLRALPKVDYNKAADFAAIETFPLAEQDRIQGSQALPVISIDELDLAQCDLIKIDVGNGIEAVIESALKTIERLRPVIFIDSRESSPTGSLRSLMLTLGYKMYDCRPTIYNGNNFFENPVNIFGTETNRCLVCVHESNVCPLEGVTEVRLQSS